MAITRKYVWNPHGNQWRGEVRIGETLSNGHEQDIAERQGQSYAMLRPIPPLALRDDSDMPMTVRINAAAHMA